MSRQNATQTIELSPELQSRLGIPLQTLTEFCQTHQITELAVFGSILRDDFKPTSDIDFLVQFAPEAQISLLGIIRLETELQKLLKRDVDLVSKRAIENSANWIRRQNILENAQVIYAQG
ncbi:MAG: nucleotidyltransferase family protein [Spirulinaceae cyanobacterium]